MSLYQMIYTRVLEASILLSTCSSGVIGCSGRNINRQCLDDEFQCTNENRNQILTINDFNKEKEKCIPNNFRCDGRHDCQDGSDEYGCDFSSVTYNKQFLCYQGDKEAMKVIDCITQEKQRDKHLYNAPVDNLITLSVSESMEWVCTKTIYPNGTINRGCEKTYTGGEAISICFWSDQKVTPKKCLCSRQMCNDSPMLLATPVTLLITLTVWIIK